MKLPLRLTLALLLASCPAVTAPLAAADSTPAAATAEKEKSYIQQLEEAGVKFTHGPATVPLGTVAQFKLPAGTHAVAKDSIPAFYKITQNGLTGLEAGVVIADEGWTLFFDYEDSGYVKDDEKKDLEADAPKLLKQRQEGQERNNAARKEQGWAAMKVVGWAKPPYYDESIHSLRWALSLSSERDNYQSTWVNEDIRLLGRSGTMTVTLVTGPQEFKAHSAAVQTLLAKDFSYVSGQKYSEFKQGDKVAAYGLSALVLGGGVAVAAKMGWLAKFWKFLVFGVAAIGAWIVKMFRKVTGRAEPPTGT